MAGMTEEGVIRFRLEHRPAAAVAEDVVADLSAWRLLLHRCGLLGQSPDRYGGLGYGNVSLRLTGSRFLVSGTQTGGVAWLGAGGYATVTDACLASNRVISEGPVKPSSESLTHAAVFVLDGGIGSVLHVHCPEIWRTADALRIPSTPVEVPYGTPEMARAVAELCRRQGWSDRGLLVMGGHEDGVIAFGPDPATAALPLLQALARALARAAGA